MTIKKERKTRGKAGFFFQLLPLISSSQGMESIPIYRSGRKTCCLLGCQILTLDSNQKDPNHWFKVVIMV